MSRWIELYATSPSGKTLFVCKYCGRISPLPDKTCNKPPEVGAYKFAMSCVMLEEVALAMENQPVGEDCSIYVSVGADGVHGQVSWRKGNSPIKSVPLTMEGARK